MKIIRCPDCNSARVQYLAIQRNLAYLQSELTQEWYTPNITTQDIQADPNPTFRCIKCDNEWTDDVQEKLYQKIVNGEEVSASDVKQFFPVYKLQHFGELENADMPVTAMHKFALTPLIPSMIKNSELDHLHRSFFLAEAL